MQETLQNIQSVLEEFEYFSQQQNYGELYLSKNRAGFTENDIMIMKIGYKQIIWSQINVNDPYIMPMPTEATLMELWIMQYIIYKRLNLKTTRENSKYATVGLAACYMYMPQRVAMYDERKLEQVNAYIWARNRAILQKLSQENFTHMRRLAWAIQMAASNATKNKSPMKYLFRN
jgi:hypothetical protein